jgi:hypothetical protein
MKIKKSKQNIEKDRNEEKRRNVKHRKQIENERNNKKKEEIKFKETLTIDAISNSVLKIESIIFS